jgi:hypothetical protein
MSERNKWLTGSFDVGLKSGLMLDRLGGKGILPTKINSDAKLLKLFHHWRRQVRVDDGNFCAPPYSHTHKNRHPRHSSRNPFSACVHFFFFLPQTLHIVLFCVCLFRL